MALEAIILWILGSFLSLFIIALIFRWTLSVGRQVRQNDRLFELMCRIAEQQGVSREEVNWIYKRHETPSSRSEIDHYSKAFKKTA